MKILYISGTRADFGLMKSILKKIKADSRFELKIVATGMHLMPEFGNTVTEIEQEGYTIIPVDETYKEDSRQSMAEFIGRTTTQFTTVFKEEKPDIVLILGDRGEALAGTIAAAYIGIPVAHVHGGEVSGTIDESARHAITKLAHIHLTSTPKASERIIKMGEEKWRVHTVGAPSLDTILTTELPTKSKIHEQFNFNPKKPLVLVVQHPNVMEYEQCEQQMRETMGALQELGQQTIIIYPNADAGGRKMIKIIQEYEDEEFIQSFKSLPYETYLGIMDAADVMIGNSSSAIIESPSFKTPAVNIGTREEGREQAVNVINCGHIKKEILVSISKAMSSVFKGKIKNCKNPYGDGKTSDRVIKILTDTEVNQKLLQKKLTY